MPIKLTPSIAICDDRRVGTNRGLNVSNAGSRGKNRVDINPSCLTHRISPLVL